MSDKTQQTLYILQYFFCATFVFIRFPFVGLRPTVHRFYFTFSRCSYFLNLKRSFNFSLSHPVPLIQRSRLSELYYNVCQKSWNTPAF